MDQLLHTVLLGIIEGVTEFLPISSTGHLLIAEHWLGERSDLFNVAIQAGAILAVVFIYWQRLWGMLLGFARPENRNYLIKLSVTLHPDPPVHGVCLVSNRVWCGVVVPGVTQYLFHGAGPESL